MSKYLVIVLFFAMNPLLSQYSDEDTDTSVDDESFESVDSQDSEVFPEQNSQQPSFSRPTIIHADESDEPDSGNWFEKLKWWKEAKWLYTIDITASMARMDSLVKTFQDKAKTILEPLEVYSSSLPIKRQAAASFIDELILGLQKKNEELAQQQTKTKVRGVSKESAELEEKQKLLNQLKDTFKDYNTLVQRLTQTFEQVVTQQMDEARRYDEKALHAYESIEKTLDDKKAQALYEVVQNSNENILALIDYLEGPLMQFVDKAWDKVQQVMPSIQNILGELEKKGVTIHQKSAEETKQEKLLAQKKLEEKKAADAYAALPWWKKIFVSLSSFFSSLWHSVVGFFTGVVSFFGSSENKTIPAQKAPLKKKAAPLASS